MREKTRDLINRLKKLYGIEYTVGHDQAIHYGMDKHPLISEAIDALRTPQDGRTALRNLIGAGIEYGARGEWPVMATMEQLIDRILAENGLTDIGVPPLKLKEPPNEPT